MEYEEPATSHIPQNKKTAESKLRRSKKHCPICLTLLAKIAPRTRLMKSCATCHAHPSLGKQCLHCSARAIWETKSKAACQSCGRHGAKQDVIMAA